MRRERGSSFIRVVSGKRLEGASLETLPHEVLLHILSYLDIPDLGSLARVSPFVLAPLVRDRQLHAKRLRVVAPSRVSHALFGLGGSVRPSIPDLVHWGILRGLGIERRWRSGLYFNSRESVRQYETSRRLHQTHVRHLLETHLVKRILPAHATSHSSECKSTSAVTSTAPTSPTPRKPKDPEARCSPRLLPTLRTLKWSQRRDAFARMVRSGRAGASSGAESDRSWFEGRGYGIWEESERVRLAICPGVRKFVRFWESGAKQN